MADLKHGGPAFPQAQCPQCGSGHESHTVEDKGMSLRDWFAGQALAGMHARDAYDVGTAAPKQRAALAYIDADAMLAERAK